MKGSLLKTPYNSITQEWWRIRESGGTTYADVSSDLVLDLGRYLVLRLNMKRRTTTIDMASQKMGM